MKRIIAALVFYVAAFSAHAQTCNDPGGFIKSFGTINIGDVVQFGPDCQHIESGSSAPFVFLNGFFLGRLQNVLISPGDPSFSPGGNSFSGGIITQILTGNFQVNAYQLPPTLGTIPDWGPVTEFVSRRIDGTNFQRISLTSMANFAGPALNDAATDFRLQAEHGGASTLLPIKFTTQQNTTGLYYELLTLSPSNDGNVRMFRRIDPPGLSANNLSFTLGQQRSALAPVLTGAGTQDSPKFILEGNSFDTSLHTAAIRQYIEMTSNAGAARWHLQYSLDGVGFTDMFSVTNAGLFTATTINGTTINATTFAGALTGHASLDLALTGGTVTGQTIFSSSSVLAITGNASGGGFQANAFNIWGGNNPTVSGSGASTITYPTGGVSIAINHSDGSGQLNGLTVGALQLGGVSVGAPTGTDKGLGTLNVQGAYYQNGVIGVTCAGAPTAGFTSALGIVTHC